MLSAWNVPKTHFGHKQGTIKEAFCRGFHRHIKEDNSKGVSTKLRTELITAIKKINPIKKQKHLGHSKEEGKKKDR